MGDILRGTGFANASNNDFFMVTAVDTTLNTIAVTRVGGIGALVDETASKGTLSRVSLAESTVSVRQVDTADNATRLDLVSDVNDAIARAGLGGKIRAVLDVTSIKLVSVDAGVFAFNVAPAIQNIAATSVTAQSSGRFTASLINGAAVGDVLFAESFTNPANNGFFKVVAVDGATRVSVTKADGTPAMLVNEAGAGKLSLVNGGASLTELGFDLSETATTAGPEVVFSSTDLRKSVGRSGTDLSFDVTIGSTTTTVSLPAIDGPTTFVGVDLSSNSSIFDVASDINRALRNAGLQLGPRVACC
jgi:hypothetical protein